MKTKSAFVWSNGAVKLYTVSGVYLYLAFVIYPRNTELDLSFRIYQTLQQGIFTEFLFIFLHDRAKRLQYLFGCLMKFRFSRIFPDQFIQYFINV